MNISVVGSGYAALTLSACLAEMGNQVSVFFDNGQISPEIPVNEPGLSAMIAANVSGRRLCFSESIEEAVSDADFVFLSHPHEPGNTQRVIEDLQRFASSLPAECIVVNSTATELGATNTLRGVLAEIAAVDVHIAVHPLFLKEGDAIDDLMHPDRIIAGVESHGVRTRIAELFKPFMRQQDRIHFMTPIEAELSRFAANGMLATRVSFMNEIAAIAEQCGADIEQVRQGIGADPRIGYAYLYPGVGYGGHHLPEDIQSLIAASGDQAPLLTAVATRNDLQHSWAFAQLNDALGALTGKRVAIWGLAFRPGTDDVNGSPAIVLIRQLLDAGAHVAAYDPMAIESAAEEFGASASLTFASHQYDALADADALVLMTEWKPFRLPDFNAVKRLLRTPLIVDGRNQYDGDALHQSGFDYRGVGRGHIKKL